MDADELRQFYCGDPIRLYLLDDGLETVLLGRDRFQIVVPRDTWFAAETVPDAIGDDEDGYELADGRLADEYEAHRDLVERLT